MDMDLLRTPTEDFEKSLKCIEFKLPLICALLYMCKYGITQDCTCFSTSSMLDRETLLTIQLTSKREINLLTSARIQAVTPVPHDATIGPSVATPV